jgi:beta-glucosidase
MAKVVFKRVSKVFADGTAAVRELDLEISDGEVLVLVGPSGSGKTTAMRMLAGLEKPSLGEIWIGDQLVNDDTPKQRDLAMVFQGYALYEHMTVYKNMAFALKGLPRKEIRRRVEETAELLGISSLLDRTPPQLSGGQRQRVAMGRALVRRPQAFLLDEPLSSLDAKLRMELRTEIGRILRIPQQGDGLGTTTLYVTHDQIEAMTIADRIGLMKDGVLDQIGTPEELYDEPRTAFVASFIGSPPMNLVSARLIKKGRRHLLLIGSAELPLPAEVVSSRGLAPYLDRELIVGMRPEHLRQVGKREPALRGEVVAAEATGPETVVRFRLKDAEPLLISANGEAHTREPLFVASLNGYVTLRAGDALELTADARHLRFFDPETLLALKPPEQAEPERVFRGDVERVQQAQRRARRLRIGALTAIVLSILGYWTWGKLDLFAPDKTPLPRELASDRSAPYLDPTLPVEQRVDDLLSRMTVAEKIGQLTQLDAQGASNPNYPLERITREVGIGAWLNGGSVAPGNSPREWVDEIGRLQRETIQHSRLHIPMIFGFDALHGPGDLGRDKTVFFSQNLGAGAAFDPALLERLQSTSGRILRAGGVQWDFAPVTDVSRDLRWGRYYEDYSEEPLLVSRLTVAAVRGLQGPDPAHPQVAATLKHFIAYSQTTDGVDAKAIRVSMPEIQRWFVPSFRSGLDAGALTVMNQHAWTNGVPMVVSKPLLQGVLRKQLGFSGVLDTDYGDILNLVCHCVGADALLASPAWTQSNRTAVRAALEAGVDVSMVGPADPRPFILPLAREIQAGHISMARLDESVRRVLRLKFQLGLFEHPYGDAKELSSIDFAAFRQNARKLADESLTLLKNKDGVLPLAKTGKPILVVGPGEDSIRMQLGGWSYAWQGAPRNARLAGTSVVEAIRQASGREVIEEPDWTLTDRIKDDAGDAGVAVVVLGEQPYAEWLGDTKSAALPKAHRALVKAIASTGTPVVLVVISGRPVMLGDLLPSSQAVVSAFLPGTEGGSAVADLLFGKVNPSGRLPVSWPRTIADVPLVAGYKVLDGNGNAVKRTPLFPFGYGLSYTTYRTRIAGLNGRELTVAVTNTGSRAGEHTLIVQKRTASFEPTLLGFTRVSLAPGERKLVRIPLAQAVRAGSLVVS